MDGLAIAAALTEIKKAARGGSIRTIYQPEQWTFVVHLFAGRTLRLLLSPREAEIHLTNLDLPHPMTPSSFTMLLRKHLRGGRIVRIEQDGWERVVRIGIVRRTQEGERNLELIAELIGIRGNLILLAEGHVIAALRPDPRALPGEPYRPLPRQEKLDPRTIAPRDLSGSSGEEDLTRTLVKKIDGIGKLTAEEIVSQVEGLPSRIPEVISRILSYVKDPIGCYAPDKDRAFFFPVQAGERMENFSAALDREYKVRNEEKYFTQEKKNLRLGLERALAKRKNTLRKLDRWLKDAEKEDVLRRWADLILINPHEIPRGVDRIELTDPQTGSLVEVPLDPRRGPIENAQSFYERAKRLRRGRPRVKARKNRIMEEISLLTEGLNALRAGGVPSAEAIALIPNPSAPRKRIIPTAPRVYQIDGYTVEVGKNAVQNDSLLQRARPDDLWLHAKGLPGAHVIVRRRGRETIPPPVVEAAARLAARFSKGGEEKRVEVSVTPVKYVRKPKGAPPGLVILSQEDTLTVKPYPEKE